MPVHGDMNGLKQLGERIRQLTTAGFKADLSKALAARAWRETLQGFQQSRDPYGTPWKTAKRGGKTLVDSGQMRQSVSAEATGNGFRLRIGTIYAGTHQYGATILPRRARALRFRVGDRVIFAKSVTIPQRQMVPMKETGGLGPIWLAAFNQTAEQLIRARLKGAA